MFQLVDPHWKEASDRAVVRNLQRALTRAGFDPNEPRDHGRWTDGGSSGDVDTLDGPPPSKPADGGPDPLAQHLTGDHIMANIGPYKANSRKVEEVAKQLNAHAGQVLQQRFHTPSITRSAPETDDFLAEAIANDLKASLNNGHSSPTWYSDKMKEAMSIAAELHPEIAADPGKRFAYISTLAITSQGEVVDASVRLTEAAYQIYNSTGKFPTDMAVADPGINGNFKKMNALIERFGVAGTHELFDREYTVRELANATGYKVGKVGLDDKVNGSAVLGPKIGLGFYQNLNGNFKPLTMDLWFMRSWGRMTNTGIGHVDMGPGAERLRNALKDDGKKAPADLDKLYGIAQDIADQHEKDYAAHRDEYKSGARKKSELVHASERYVYNYAGAMVEAPKSGGHRRWITHVFTMALDKLKQQGIELEPAAAQATWWNPEKVLFKHLGGRVRELDTDYAKSLRKLADTKQTKALDMTADPLLQSAPWIDDPDEPDRMGDGQIAHMVDGFAKLAPDLVVLKTFDGVLRFDPGEPRDEHGRWTDGGSSADSAGVAFVSPNIGNLTFAEAATGLNSERQEALRRASADVDQALNKQSVNAVNVVGAWADGAENSLMLTLPSDWTPAQARVALAMKGWLGDQKSALLFTPDPKGEAYLASVPMRGSLDEIHAELLQAGLAFHTLQPTDGGATVHVYGTDQATADAVDAIAGKHGSQAHFTFGAGEFIGTTKEDGTDREQRDDARAQYEAVIGAPAAGAAFPGRDVAAVWQDLRDRWGRELSETAVVPGYAPGVKARNDVGEINKHRDRWVADSPVQSLDQTVAMAPKAQGRLAKASNEIAAAMGLKFIDPGPKTKNQKGVDRLRTKAVKYKGKLARVTDVARGTFLVNKPEQADQIIEHLGEKFEVIAEAWRTLPSNYTDRALLVRDTSGMIAEVQIMDPTMFAMKNEMHHLYDEARELPPHDPHAKNLTDVMKVQFARVLDAYPPDWKAALGIAGTSGKALS